MRMPDFEFIGRKMTNNFCTETYDFTAQQQFTHYLVFGSNDAGSGTRSYTRVAPVGYPIVELPFVESFSGTQSPNNWGVTELVENDSYYSDWRIADESYYEDYKPFDNDKGLLCMHTVSGGVRDLCSPLIKLPQELGLSLQFHYAIPDPTTSLKVKVSTDYGYSWDTVAEIEGGSAKKWTAIEVNMDAYAGKTICFAFEGSAEELSKDIVVDNIKLGKFSAVSEVSNDNGVMVNVDGNKICVTSPDAIECHVYDVSGRMIASGEAADVKPFETVLPAGIFIVEADGKGYKIRIR